MWSGLIEIVYRIRYRMMTPIFLRKPTSAHFAHHRRVSSPLFLQNLQFLHIFHHFPPLKLGGILGGLLDRQLLVHLLHLLFESFLEERAAVFDGGREQVVFDGEWICVEVNCL